MPDGSKLFEVKSRHEHPDFNLRPLTTDLAILQLERKLSADDVFGNNSGVTELPYTLATKDIWAADELKVVKLAGFRYCDRNARLGFGRRRAAEEVLAAVSANADEARIVGCNFGTEFAVGGQGVDTCNGDSVGPVFAKSKDGKLWCIGATSRPSLVRLANGTALSGSGTPDTCGDGGVYTLIHKYPWIRETIDTLHRRQ